VEGLDVELTLEQAKSFCVMTGRYRWWTLGAILQRDPEYLRVLAKRPGRLQEPLAVLLGDQAVSKLVDRAIRASRSRARAERQLNAWLYR
jgi:hypothetical protein